MTAQELKEIREWNDDWDTQRGCRWPVLDLVEEVERLQQALEEAITVIGIGMPYSASELRKKYFPTPTCQQREDGGNNTPDSKRPC